MALSPEPPQASIVVKVSWDNTRYIIEAPSGSSSPASIDHPEDLVDPLRTLIEELTSEGYGVTVSVSATTQYFFDKYHYSLPEGILGYHPPLEPAKGVITKITAPTEPVAVGTTVDVAVAFANSSDADLPGTFRIDYQDSTGEISGSTDSITLNPGFGTTKHIYFTMPSHNVSLTIELIRIT